MTAKIISEEWKSVVGYEGFYEVSNRGDIRSLDRIRQMFNLGGYYERMWPGKALKQRLSKYGYFRIGLTSDDGIRTDHSAHTLVANAFIGTCPKNKSQINHKDCVKTNNRPENLEWCTNSENHKHAYANGHQALNNHRCEKTGRMLPKNETEKAGTGR